MVKSTETSASYEGGGGGGDPWKIWGTSPSLEKLRFLRKDSKNFASTFSPPPPSSVGHGFGIKLNKFPGKKILGNFFVARGIPPWQQKTLKNYYLPLSPPPLWKIS